MIPLDYVLAVAVLMAPEVPRGEHPEEAGEGLTELTPLLQRLALSWEMMDPREVPYLMARPEDFPADIQLLRRRYQALDNAPPLSDCWRFPERSLASEFLEFNRAYRAHLVRRHAIEGVFRAELAEAIREVDQLYQIWDAVRDARSECYYVTVRRQALKSLRETLGPEAYSSGHLPPHVPIWRFARRD